MTQPTILTVAITGNQTTVAQNAALPVTPEQIANSTIEAAAAGAAISHIHVRYPDGTPSMEMEHYREVVERIRNSGCDILINLTTGPGQRFIPSRDNPRIAAPGTTLMAAEDRVAHVLALRPDICTLDFNTMWSGETAVINAPWSISQMAEAILSAGVKPELELFDSGDIHLAQKMIADKVLPEPVMLQIVTGVSFGFDATAETMAYARSLLPANAVWAAFGIGRMAFPMLAQAWILGGHVRIGLEDMVYIRRGVLAPDNASLVRKAAQIIDDLGGTLATPDQARTILGLS